MHLEYPLLKELPPIRRARGGYLYTENGQRIIDLWLQNATIVHGHQTQTLLSVAKNALSRTFFAGYPNIWHDKVITLYAKHFQADHAIIAPSNSKINFKEPWHHHPEGHYILRPSISLPSNISIAKIPLPLQGMALYLFWSSQDNIQIDRNQSAILPAYIAQILLRELPHFQGEPTHNQNKTTHFAHYNAYFEWYDDPLAYQDYFLQALQQKILLPPDSQAIGLWLPQLFSEKQNQLIQSILD